MASAKDIRFDQRNVTNTAYQEKYVNGNSLILRTDSTGSVVGTSTLEGVAIGTTTPSTANFTNVTASVISSSVLIGNFSGSLSGSNIIANNISSSTLYVSQNIINDGTLTVVGNSTLSNVTSSNISASGNISSSNLFVSNNTTLGNGVNDLIKITGSLSLSGSTFTNSSSFVDLTANRVVYTDNNRILSTDDDLIFNGNALTASNLLANTVDINGGTIDGTTIGLTSATTAKFTEITASNISASGNISSSTADFNTLTSILSTLFNVTSSNISASGYISSSTVDTTNLISVNNILTNITSSNISASGQITATGFSGSVYGTSSWSNNSLTASYFGSGSNNYFPIWISNKLSYDSLISQSNNQIAILSDTASFLGDDLIINKSDPFYSNNNPTIDASNSPNQTLMLAPNVMLGGDGNSEHWNRFNSDGTVDFLGTSIKFTSGGAAAFNSKVTIGSSTLLGNNTLDVIGNISAYAITASNISASGNAELGTLSVRGNTVLYGDFTVFGTGSVVNISSSTVIIGDNRIQLNAWSTGTFSQRYAGLDLTDSGSNNDVTSSLLWDSANNYWLLTNNQTGSNPVVTSSALILQGPVSNFGNEKQLPANTFLKVETAIGNLTASNLSETGNTLTYNGAISASGRISSSNINVGIPSPSYPWGNSMTGSYFSTWTSDTNVSDALRFLAGAFSASFPVPTPNTKVLSSISTTNTNIGSAITINGRVPSGSTDQYINYLQPLGWATIGQTIFSGYTFRNAANYALYGSTVGGSTTISSSLGTNAFGLGLLNNGVLNTTRLSGSFTLTFASSSVGTVNYTNNTNVVVSQSSDNGTPSIATPIALRIIPSANMAVIPPIYQDGYFNNFTGSNLTNNISLSSVSSSGIYTISGYVGINSGSSTYSYFTGSNLTQYYTPLVDGNFTQTISSPGSTITASSIVTRSLSGAPYLTSGSSYTYTVTASNAFNPLYFNGTVSTTTIPSNVLGLSTANTITLTTNPTIQTANVVKSSDYTTTRTVGSYPFESDVIVFGVTMSAVGTGTTAASSGATITTFTVNNTTYNRAGSGTTIGSQTATIHTAGSFGIPSASGSLLYYGRTAGFITSSLTFSATPNTELLLDETYRMVLNDNLLNSSGSYFNSASYLPTSSLQVKPGFLVNQGGVNGYWYPSGYGTTYKYYVRYFKSAAVVNTLRITLTGNTTLVRWDETTSNSIAIGLIFESGNSNTYARCRIYDIANLANNIVSSSISTSNLSTDGKNPFSANIDLYGNNGSGASNSGGVINIPLRNVDGMTLDSTVASKDELYVIVRYNGSPTPLTSLKIEKSA